MVATPERKPRSEKEALVTKEKKEGVPEKKRSKRKPRKFKASPNEAEDDEEFEATLERIMAESQGTEHLSNGLSTIRESSFSHEGSATNQKRDPKSTPRSKNKSNQ